MSGIVLSKEFAYPAAAAVSTFWLLIWQTFRVSRARRAAKVDYPQVYAEKAEAAANQAALKFNCAQRAHQNTLETIPMILTSTLITGLKYPVLAASLCGAWTFSRIFYTIGYSSGDPKKRYMGGNLLFGIVGMFGLLLGSTATVVSFVRAL
ncbi:hypothetical protein GSI_06124 [Ganoderma sinense ZZ0214-1]|uniref:Uncharacterized protein n=1 Tax=Ganoderma sinense ZZ0214-1 TaxID=1077348 RepID=A0A2G8SCE9_9APHY|nr:hypothetical protein GSI_06124 [Ganoderma sinense ZZ0214-1]